eukprot:TRINITY_DN22891_c0_g2_i3.p2 TRINITY_DN22891_c0_g2~~TRINITY_DN22891_c0_g2_i3.p2  ORF type:complete len:181 (-),score=13.14 TRINITY_DN22891_c0_g2_i3:533-1075(-)
MDLLLIMVVICLSVTCCIMFCVFFFNDTATTEIYTRSIVGSVRCVQETGVKARTLIKLESNLKIDIMRDFDQVRKVQSDHGELLLQLLHIRGFHELNRLAEHSGIELPIRVKKGTILPGGSEESTPLYYGVTNREDVSHSSMKVGGGQHPNKSVHLSVNQQKYFPAKWVAGIGCIKEISR